MMVADYIAIGVLIALFAAPAVVLSRRRSDRDR
jgi:hypothetical protein